MTVMTMVINGNNNDIYDDADSGDDTEQYCNGDDDIKCCGQQR